MFEYREEQTENKVHYSLIRFILRSVVHRDTNHVNVWQQLVFSNFLLDLIQALLLFIFIRSFILWKFKRCSSVLFSLTSRLLCSVCISIYSQKHPSMPCFQQSLWRHTSVFMFLEGWTVAEQLVHEGFKVLDGALEHSLSDRLTTKSNLCLIHQSDWFLWGLVGWIVLKWVV